MCWKGMICLGFQSMCYSSWSLVITTGNPLLTHSGPQIIWYLRSDYGGWDGWTMEFQTVIGPFANTGFQCPSPETGTAYGSEPLRRSLSRLLSSEGLPGGKQFVTRRASSDLKCVLFHRFVCFSVVLTEDMIKLQFPASVCVSILVD
jgi:hypothetical protein